MVRRGLTGSRGEAQQLIAAGAVVVAGRPSARAATLVAPDEAIDITTDQSWASRAGGKLDGALDHFEVEVGGMRCLDVGASTGGFTDVLLARGAASVLALDVGYGQLIWRLRTDPRVEVVDRVNFRTIDVTSLGDPFDVVVVDVSFISVALLAQNLAAAGTESATYLVLVKPQFEVGRGSVGPGGVVTNHEARLATIESVANALTSVGVSPRGVMAATVVGSAGNQEYVMLARKGSKALGFADLTGDLAG